MHAHGIVYGDVYNLQSDVEAEYEELPLTLSLPQPHRGATNAYTAGDVINTSPICPAVIPNFSDMNGLKIGSVELRAIELPITTK